jgi:hypothetical protein
MNNLFKQSELSPPGSPNLEQAAILEPLAPGREQTMTDKGTEMGVRSTYMEKAAVLKSEMVANSQAKQLEKLNQISELDWKKLPPPMLASMLVQIPFKGSGTEPDYFLAPVQAMIFAMRCFELGLSPFSNEVWFNPKNNKVNVSFEGKLKLARMAGLNLSPPVLERIPAERNKPLEAYKCTITTPTGKCEYTASLKDWQVASSPVWKTKQEHMLQLRASEKCLSFVIGAGASELPDDKDLQAGEEAERVMPKIEVVDFREAK